jgi:hypothetical protein
LSIDDWCRFILPILRGHVSSTHGPHVGEPEQLCPRPLGALDKLLYMPDENDSGGILTDSSSAVMPSPTGRNSDVPQHLHAPQVTGLRASEQSAIGADKHINQSTRTDLENTR